MNRNWPKEKYDRTFHDYLMIRSVDLIPFGFLQKMYFLKAQPAYFHKANFPPLWKFLVFFFLI